MIEAHTKYIYKTKNNTYHIRKTKNGEVNYFGSGKTLIEALMKRDYFEAEGWVKPSFTPSYISKTGDGKFVIKRTYWDKDTGSVTTIHFGVFSSYEDAEEEVELLKKYDWDICELCECE